METRGSFTCHDGWHVVARGTEVAYVHVGVRLRDAHGTYVYRVGPVPDEAACGTVWAYEDKGTPWTCAACGGPISDRRHNPFGPTQRASFEEALIEPCLYAVPGRPIVAIAVATSSVDGAAGRDPTPAQNHDGR